MLSKDVSSTTFWVFGMTRPEIESRSPGRLVNTLPLSQWAGYRGIYWHQIRHVELILPLVFFGGVGGEFLLSWSVSVPSWVADSEVTSSWSIRNSSSALKLLEMFRNATSWNFEFLSYCSLAYISSHLQYLRPHFFGKFCHNFLWKHFHHIKEKICAVCRKVLVYLRWNIFLF